MDQLDLIRRKINIVDLIGESVTLKKAGRNFKALCPFHSEKTSSFIVSPERQIWHCFGCGKGGDVFTFLMELDRLEFPEALRILAERAGVKLEYRPEESGKVKIKERLLAIHHLGAEFYHYLLTSHKIGWRARQYLKERGITDKATKTFGLGWAPNSWDNLAKFLSRKGYTDKEMIQAGVALAGKKNIYDRFRGRIIFPLKNYRGETIAFAGRILEHLPTGGLNEAKYINSPETLLYTKGETLYGMDITKEAIRKTGSAVVVEGEFDLISSYISGVSNVVAIKGTALTEMQINLLKRFTERLVLSLDADTAGDAASRRGIELADKAGMDIKMVKIPSGKDPDEAARENPVLWKKAISEAVPFYDFLLESAQSRHDAETAFGKKKISDETLPVIKKIENTIVQAHYIKKIAKLLDLTEEKIIEAMNKIKLVSGLSANQTEKAVKPHIQVLEEHLLTLIIQHTDPQKALAVLTNELDPTDLTTLPVKKIFISLVDYLSSSRIFILDEFIKLLPAELLGVFDQAYLIDLSGFGDMEKINNEIINTCKQIKLFQTRRKIRELTTKIADLDETNEDQLVILQVELKNETDKLKYLSQKEGYS